jgi:hypothetical protein
LILPNTSAANIRLVRKFQPAHLAKIAAYRLLHAGAKAPNLGLIDPVFVTLP